ncbi:MAG: hypothetical protein HGA85_01050 [Nanoarchaeota archaeon]|nr:hypothetical protein [Nanoarchaeota archaeon]
MVKSLYLILGCSVSNAIGQLLLKIGAKGIVLSLDIIKNYYLIAGLILYAASAVAMILALRTSDLSTVYPLTALGYVWVAFLSFFFFKDTLSFTNVLGICMIVCGSFFIAKGDIA